jgi:hypothetical protein
MIFSGLWNLHIVTLLVMLSRSTASGHDDYVRPVTYTCRSLSDNGGGHVVLEDEDECVLDSATSNNFSDCPPDSHLKRRQSSEDFLEMQAARQADQQCRRYCQHQYDDFSSSPDPFDDEYDEEAGVDDDEEEEEEEEEDPLETARQETVHLWEEDNNVVICHHGHGGSEGGCDTFMTTTASAGSDDAVLYGR